MNGTLTMPDGTVILLTAIALQTTKGHIAGTCRITPTEGIYVRRQAREVGQLKLVDGPSAQVRLGGVRPSNPVNQQDPMDVFHFQFVEGWD